MAKNTTPAPTPENTPVPGGGRWRWDIALPGWVEVLEDPAPTPAPAATNSPSTDPKE